MVHKDLNIPRHTLAVPILQETTISTVQITIAMVRGSDAYSLKLYQYILFSIKLHLESNFSIENTLLDIFDSVFHVLIHAGSSSLEEASSPLASYKDIDSRHIIIN